jgi:Holliday junction resolvase
MQRVRLYVDATAASKKIERELRDRGIAFVRVPATPRARQPLPAIETERQIISGCSNIRLYFLNGGR